MKKLDKVEYENRIRLKRPDLKLISEYKNCVTNVLVETKYGICSVNPISVLRTKQSSIQTAVNKNEYYENMAREIHGLKYDYTNINYADSRFKIKIICPVHGEFEMSPRSHLEGQGCPKCGRLTFVEKMLGRGDGFYNIKTAERNKEKWLHKNAIVYTVKCYDEYENFYKIGITTKDTNSRLKELPYNYEIINEIHTNLYEAILIERKLHFTHSKYHYMPEIKFNGWTECFTQTRKENELDQKPKEHSISSIS